MIRGQDHDGSIRQAAALQPAQQSTQRLVHAPFDLGVVVAHRLREILPPEALEAHRLSESRQARAERRGFRPIRQDDAARLVTSDVLRGRHVRGMRVEVAHVQEERISLGFVHELEGRLRVDVGEAVLLRPVHAGVPVRRDIPVVGPERLAAADIRVVEVANGTAGEGVVLADPARAVTALGEMLEHRAPPRQFVAVLVGERAVLVRVQAGEARLAGGNAYRAAREAVREQRALLDHPIQMRRAHIRVANRPDAVAPHLVDRDKEHVGRCVGRPARVQRR